MAIQFTCPNCDHDYNVSQKYANKKFACKQCGFHQTVPRPPISMKKLNGVYMGVRCELWAILLQLLAMLLLVVVWQRLLAPGWFLPILLVLVCLPKAMRIFARWACLSTPNEIANHQLMYVSLTSEVLTLLLSGSFVVITHQVWAILANIGLFVGELFSIICFISFQKQAALHYSFSDVTRLADEAVGMIAISVAVFFLTGISRLGLDGLVAPIVLFIFVVTLLSYVRLLEKMIKRIRVGYQTDAERI